MNRKKEQKKIKTPWPTQKAMEQVYKMRLWGEGESDFYSGIGSHQLEIVNPYKEAVITFLKSFKTSLVVCDLGCGDFNVGKDLVQHTQQYIAVDIVENLIEYNSKKFKQENLTFHCLDIATDCLPFGDCAILRQVLQHLSNTEVQNVLSKLAGFKYVVLTEHIPVGNFVPNKDIISGQGIRIKKQSGLNLLASPFNFKVIEKKQLTSVVLDNHKGMIVTMLYRVF